MKKKSLIMAVLLLSGCVSPAEHAYNGERCTERGFNPGTAEHSKCQEELDTYAIWTGESPLIYKQAKSQSEAACFLKGYKKGTEEFGYCMTLVGGSLVADYNQQRHRQMDQAINQAQQYNFQMMQQQRQPIQKQGFTCMPFGQGFSCN